MQKLKYPLLVSQQHNVFYLTGFRGLSPEEREGWAVIFPNKKYIITDKRYSDFSKAADTEIRFISHKMPFRTVLKEILESENHSDVLYFESEDITYFEHEYIAKAIEEIDMKTKPLQRAILSLREVKNKNEIDNIAEACRVTDTCFREITKKIRIGNTERDIAFSIEMWLKKKGHDLAFYPIVAFDENAAIAHYDTRYRGNNKLKKGSIILIDFGAKVMGYLSDMTRMVSMGQPSHEFTVAYDAVVQSYDKAIEAMEQSKNYAEVDAAARQIIEKAGYPTFAHATGHGLGLEIHEGPKVAPVSTDRPAKGHVVTIEPGVYLDGKFGIRFEDTVVVKHDGGVEALTKSPREITVIA